MNITWHNSDKSINKEWYISKWKYVQKITNSSPGRKAMDSYFSKVQQVI